MIIHSSKKKRINDFITIETDIFNKTSKAKNCDVKIIVDHEKPADPNLLAQINLNFADKPKEKTEEKEVET